MVSRSARRGRLAQSLGIGLVCATASVFLAWAPASAATTVNPVADTYVDATSVSRSFGNRRFLRVDGSPDRTAYLRFNVSGYTPGDTVLLRVYPNSDHSTGFDVHMVADNSWSENITYSNRPAVSPATLASSGPLQSGRSQAVDVSAAVSQNGLVSLALTTLDSTAMNLASRESANPPQLTVGAEPLGDFHVTQTPSGFVAAAEGISYSGSLKEVVEAAAHELSSTGGGSIIFGAGTYNLGPDWWELENLSDVSFVGQGIDQTIITNNSSAATDTEPFDTSNLTRVSVRDMTVHADGPYRETSDALDFDRGNDIVVERVKVTGARGRGIVFDGKENLGARQSNSNTVTDCIVESVPSDGIELLAAQNNVIQGCEIRNVGGHGIQLTKASDVADQPNKPASGNQILDNAVEGAGRDGINVNGSGDNLIAGNSVLNSSSTVQNRNGIYIGTAGSAACNANQVRFNAATDDRDPKLQRYGLNIASALCVGTVVQENDFAGNLLGPIHDVGTGTVYEPPASNVAPSAGDVDLGLVVQGSSVDWTPDVADANLDELTCSIQAPPAQGTASVATDCSLGGYSAPPGYQGPISFAYSVSDGELSAAGTVTAQVGPQPDSYSLTPVADAYVSESNPSTNYGSSSQLRVDGSPIQRSYLRFDLSGITGSISSARLRVSANSNGAAGLEVRQCTDDSWTEDGLTYTNSAVPGGIVASVAPFAGGDVFEIVVDAAVGSGDSLCLALTALSSTAVSLASREGSTPPALLVDVD